MNGRDDAEQLGDFSDIPDPLGESVPGPRVRLPAVLPPDAPVRSIVHRRRLTALALSVAWLGGHLAVYGVRTDLLSLPPLYAATQILVPFTFAVTALAVATASGPLGLGVSISAVITLCVLGPTSFLLIALGAPQPHAPPGGGDFWLGAFVCFDITLSWAAIPLLAAAMSLRKTYPVAAGWRAALVGAASGLFSGAVMNLHCPSVDRFHIALGHGIPVLAATIVGAIVVSKWVRV
jgi:hypothetical protein